MTAGKDTIQAFVRKWRDEDTGAPETEAALERVEAELGLRLPQLYRHFMLVYGNISTQRLMYSVAVGGYDLPDLMWFFSVDELLQEMAERADELPEGCFCFATRMSGDLFLFCSEDAATLPPPDPPVSLYSAEQGTVTPIAGTFSGFLESYLNVEPRD